jgi:hypothetical protein
MEPGPLEKQTYPDVNKLSTFTETAGSLPCSKQLTFVPILSQINHIYTFQSYFLR